MSSVSVPIKAKGEFSFRDNPGCQVHPVQQPTQLHTVLQVRMTKWTGKDSVEFINVRPQLVRLTAEKNIVNIGTKQ